MLQNTPKKRDFPHFRPLLSPLANCPQVHQGKLEFFPLLEALSLEKEEDEVAGQLEELKGMVRNVLERFEKEVRRREFVDNSIIHCN